MSLFSTVKVESLTSVVATPGRGGGGTAGGGGKWGNRTLAREDTDGGAAALSIAAPSQRGDKCI